MKIAFMEAFDAQGSRYLGNKGESSSVLEKKPTGIHWPSMHARWRLEEGERLATVIRD